MTFRSITAEEAYHRCNPQDFPFETTAEVEELNRFIGQERALEAVGLPSEDPSRVIKEVLKK